MREISFIGQMIYLFNTAEIKMEIGITRKGRKKLKMKTKWEKKTKP